MNAIIMSASVESIPKESLLMNHSGMESISRVAIRNINPPQIDPNDPDQRKLIEHLKRLQAINIWEYSDNQPSFLASLNRNNPTDQRKVIESIIVKSVTFDNAIPSLTNLSAGGEPGTLQGTGGGTTIPNNSTAPRIGKGTIGHSSKFANIEDTLIKRKYGHPQHGTVMEPTIENQTTNSLESHFNAFHEVHSFAPPEMKMIIRKTLELILDMSKSVELVYHAIRASARFLTYPTPSVPSDNYVFGHVKGWIWLIYKSLANFDPENQENLHKLNQEMSKLSAQARELNAAYGGFNQGLKSLYESIKKEAKVLKYQNRVWSLRIEAFLQFEEDLKQKKNLLVDIREDKPFSGDWIFEPHPSKTSQSSNSTSKRPKDFFHFQWVKTKNSWDTDTFEVRSDYSTQWHPYSDFNTELQLSMIIFLIQHLTAVLEECTSFVNINMNLSFDFDEIKCLKFAVAEILSAKRNTNTVEYIADLAKRLFQDMALLDEISEEFLNQLNWIAQVIEPCYKTIGKRCTSFTSPSASKSNGNNNDKNTFTLDYLPPLEEPDSLDKFSLGNSILNRGKSKFQFCPCIRKSTIDFLELYGEPMEAVFLRTPITHEIVLKFFPIEHLIPSQVEFHLPTSARINAYGVSEGYRSSMFDQAIGRDPPLKKVKRLPKFRRNPPPGSAGGKESKFDLTQLLQHSKEVIRTTDGEIDTENYLKLFEQIKKFLQAFGTMFNFILSDITEKLENLDNKLYTGLSDHFESLEKIVGFEMTAGIIQTDPWTSGTRAFRRVNIALMFFTLFLTEVVKLGETDGTYYPCKMSYYKSYARYHSWFVQKTSSFSIYSLPNKKLVYGKVCPNIELVEVDKVLEEFVKNATAICDHCENLFKTNQLSDL